MKQVSRSETLRDTTYDRTGSASLESYMGEVAGRFAAVAQPTDSSLILTDDKAPVEVLGMRAIDQLIAEEAGPYREILQKEGIGGLLRAVQ